MSMSVERIAGPTACRPARELVRRRAARRYLRRGHGVRDRGRHRSRQGHRARVRASRRVDRDRQSQARAPRGRARGCRRVGRTGDDGRVRHPRRRADLCRVRRRHRGLRAARGPDQQRGRQLPGAGRGHVAQRVAHGGRHHAQWHVLLRARVHTSASRSEHAGVDRERRRVVRLDGWSGLRAQRGGQGRGQEHDRDPRGRVGSVRNPGQWPGARAFPARRHDRRHQGQSRSHE